MKRAVPLVFAWVCLVLVVAAPSPAWAQEAVVGHRAVAEAEVNLRDAIPIGLFAESQVVGVIRQGETSRFLRRETLPPSPAPSVAAVRGGGRYPVGFDGMPALRVLPSG